MDDRKTLIILTPGFPVNEADTACLPSIQVFVKNLQKDRPTLNIVIISFQYPFFAREYTWNNIRVIGFGGANKGKVKRVLIWAHVWQSLKWLHETHHISGILSLWLGECALLGKRFAKKYNIMHYAWLLGQDAKAKNLYQFLTKPSGDELIAISDAVAKVFFESYGTRISTVIPIGVDGSLFKKVNGERTIDIMGAGSLIPLKRYDLFLQVVNAAKQEVDQLKVVLCGEGPEKEKLYSLIDEWKLHEEITLAGEVSHNATLELMQQTKVFLHTSSYEGFSTVCAEALRAGAYVISFCKPMIHDFEHWIVVASPEEMIRQAVLLLKNSNPDHSPVSTYCIHDTVTRIMGLFDL